MLAILEAFANDESGATAIEYALIVALIAIACVTALNGINGELVSDYQLISSKLKSAQPG